MRIIREIEIEGKDATTLFDTGSFNTYVERRILKGVSIYKIPKFKVSLGGTVFEVKEACIIKGKIEGLDFDTYVIPVNDLGTVDGKKLHAIIGAMTMEKWEIKIDTKTGELDLSGLKRREFTEYLVNKYTDPRR